MTENIREIISILFTLFIIFLVSIITQRFFLPLAWGAIIAIISWPLYLRWEKMLGHRQILAALTLTLLVTLLVAWPLYEIIKIIIKEAYIFTNFLISANTHGEPTPTWIQHLPWMGNYLTKLWEASLAKPQSITSFLATGPYSLKPVSEFVKNLSLQVAHRSVTLGFAILCLFFFYKDGQALMNQIDKIGNYFLGKRWDIYSKSIPSAIKATVNGLVLVGIGVGILMGISYALLGVPAPALVGALTAILAMIPFGAPIAFVIVALVLLAKGNFLASIIILVWGTLVMFVADHFVRPSIIGGVTQLPFLAVLFGILGGVETFGLIGLFIGPAIMVLFVTLWRETALFLSTKKGN